MAEKNSKPSVKLATILWALCALLLVAASLTFTSLRRNRSRMESEARNLAACREIAAKIQALSERPMLAVSQAKSYADLSERIEAAAEVAALSIASIDRIEPQPARQLAESPYEEHSTQIDLNSVSIEQLVRFLVSLSQGQPNLDVRRIDLEEPQYNAQPTEQHELWNVEVVLTYFVFVPTTPSS